MLLYKFLIQRLLLLHIKMVAPIYNIFRPRPVNVLIKIMAIFTINFSHNCPNQDKCKFSAK